MNILFASKLGDEVTEEYIRQENELEKLTAEFMTGKFDAESFSEKIEKLDVRVDLRRAGEKLTGIGRKLSERSNKP